MIFITPKGFRMKYQWGLYIVPKTHEVCLKLSPYYRIYMRPRKSWLFPNGGVTGVFEPGWVEHCPDFVPGHWRAPHPSRITRVISWFVPALRRRIAFYQPENYYAQRAKA